MRGSNDFLVPPVLKRLQQFQSLLNIFCSIINGRQKMAVHIHQKWRNFRLGFWLEKEREKAHVCKARNILQVTRIEEVSN